VTDTVGFVEQPAKSNILKTTRNSDGSITTTQSIPSPILIVDDWAVASDGSVAFVPGQDYHIDWVNVDGTRTSTPPIAHNWQQLSDSAKTAIIDSTKHFVDSVTDVMLVQLNKNAGTKQSVVFVWPEVSDIPDYRSVITELGIVRAGADNDLWIRQGGSSFLLPGSANTRWCTTS
jgi:hypothetical protein